MFANSVANSEASGITPHEGIFSYDGVVTTEDGCTKVVGRASFSLNNSDSGKDTGICYCVRSGTVENLDVTVTAASEEMGTTLTVKNGASTCYPDC